MDFSEALSRLKAGRSMRRAGWNAQNQFVYHVPAGNYIAETEVALEAFRTPINSNPVYVPYGAYLAIKTVQGNVVPWLASQTDLLANDWEYFKETK